MQYSIIDLPIYNRFSVIWKEQTRATRHATPGSLPITYVYRKLGDGKDSSQKLTDCCMCGISTPSLAGSRRRYCSKGSGMRLGFKVYIPNRLMCSVWYGLSVARGTCSGSH